MDLILGVGGLVVAVVLVILTLGTQMEERATIRTSLRRLDGFDITDTRDKELLAPFHQRAIAPVVRRVVGFGRDVTPVGYVDRARFRLTQAGWPGTDALDRFLVLRVVTGVLAPIVGFVLLFVVGLDGLNGLLITGLAVLVFILGPEAWLNRKVEERARAIRVSLPDVLDLLVISVEAGLGFEQALDRVVDSVPGPLPDEFVRMLGEVRAGSSRADALRAMETRVDVREVRSFIFAMLQADTFGVSIGRVLRAQADEMRIRRRQMAQEEAQKAPVKMLIPMVFCIFPALFVIVLGPAMLDILDAFG